MRTSKAVATRFALGAAALILPWAVSNRYYLHVLNLVGLYSLIVVGLNILSGYTGQVSMGQAGYFAVGTYGSSERGFYYLIYSVLFLGMVAAARLSNSKVGRTFIAIREDELAAEAMGVPTDLYKVSAFAISAFYAGIAGALFGPFAGVASPDNFTFEDSVGFLCMSVVGGNRSIYGALTGVLMLTALSEALRFLQSFRLIIYGVILLATVIYMPQGLSGLFPTAVRAVNRLLNARAESHESTGEAKKHERARDE